MLTASLMSKCRFVVPVLGLSADPYAMYLGREIATENIVKVQDWRYISVAFHSCDWSYFKFYWVSLWENLVRNLENWHWFYSLLTSLVINLILIMLYLLVLNRCMLTLSEAVLWRKMPWISVRFPLESIKRMADEIILKSDRKPWTMLHIPVIPSSFQSPAHIATFAHHPNSM